MPLAFDILIQAGADFGPLASDLLHLMKAGGASLPLQMQTQVHDSPSLDWINNKPNS